MVSSSRAALFAFVAVVPLAAACWNIDAPSPHSCESLHGGRWRTNDDGEGYCDRSSPPSSATSSSGSPAVPNDAGEAVDANADSDDAPSSDAAADR